MERWSIRLTRLTKTSPLANAYNHINNVYSRTRAHLTVLQPLIDCGGSVMWTSRHKSCHFSSLFSSAQLPYSAAKQNVWHSFHRLFLNFRPHPRWDTRRSKLLLRSLLGSYTKLVKLENQSLTDCAGADRDILIDVSLGLASVCCQIFIPSPRSASLSSTTSCVLKILT